jgi:hypothetical protein
MSLADYKPVSVPAACKLLTNTVVEGIHDIDKNMVTGVSLKDVSTGRKWEQDVSGFFVAIGHIPNTKPFVGQIDLDPDGYIISKGGARTNLQGVFHAGDVQDRVYRQAITAAGAGCMAAIEAERFLRIRRPLRSGESSSVSFTPSPGVSPNGPIFPEPPMFSESIENCGTTFSSPDRAGA